MSIAAGARLGPYEIVALIVAGGMMKKWRSDRVTKWRRA
jgi:hypothetical protein